MRKLDKFQENNDTVLLIGPGNTLSQSFKSTKDQLSGIRILVYNPRLGGTIKYDLEIRGEDDGVLRKDTVSESNLGWAYHLRYDFLPIQNSADKSFKLVILYGGAGEEKNNDLSVLNLQLIKGQLDNSQNADIRDKIQKNYLGWAYSYSDRSKDGTAFINEVKLDGDFVFQSYYSNDLKGFITDTGTGFISKIKYDPIFFVFYIILILCLSAILVKKYFFKASIKPK